MEKRVRLKDIAKEAGLSVSAVSMALKNDGTIAAKTVERVKRVARDMGYAPDPALSALSAYRTRLKVRSDFSVIGLVTNWSERDSWSQREQSKEVIRGAKERAMELGYTLQIFWAREEGASPKRFTQILKVRGIRGLVLAPFEDNDEVLDMDWNHFSVVMVSRPSNYAYFHHVVQNHYMDMTRCWEILSERGYSRVGLIVGREFALRWKHQWEAAHLYGCSRNLDNEDPIPILEIEGDQEVAMIRDWLKRYKPDAVINRSAHFHEALAAEGLETPRDIGYVSLNVNDDIENATGIKHRRDVLGAMAVDALNNLLHRNVKGPSDVITGTQVDGVWEEGETLPDLKV
jgi:DNA-binding LacI/PurR family transcriptional regulator